jgi:hypothetical protein
MDDDKRVQPTIQKTQEAAPEKPVDYTSFAGTQSCKKCHADISKAHSKSNHFKTSMPADEQAVKGSFAKGRNEYTYNPELKIVMEKRDTSLYQVVIYQGKEVLALPFGVTAGSGTKGQSYMHWQQNRLFQMPLTYFNVAEQWANSPGFPNRVQYERPITSRCMECHTTQAEVVSPPGSELDEFDKNKIIYGVSCEKCHGPGKNHVDFHEQNKAAQDAKYIINPAKLTRQQNLDLCALCHGGRLERRQPAFTYQVGDSLSKFFNTDNLHKAPKDYAGVDVHGNQFGLLSASKCFIKSDMTCNTCHTPHENERGKIFSFSEKCQSCHKEIHNNGKQFKNISAAVIKTNCIDCHMPAEPSHAIVFTSATQAPKAAYFRTHFIAVYTKQSQQYIDSLKQSSE